MAFIWQLLAWMGLLNSMNLDVKNKLNRGKLYALFTYVMR